MSCELKILVKHFFLQAFPGLNFLSEKHFYLFLKKREDKDIIFLNIKEGVVIWAKLKQGNGRGTCCWIIYILYILYYKLK